MAYGIRTSQAAKTAKNEAFGMMLRPHLQALANTSLDLSMFDLQTLEIQHGEWMLKNLLWKKVLPLKYPIFGHVKVQ